MKASTKPIKTPVFWDLHIHGTSGIDFMHADHDAMLHACETLGRNGIGAFAPTLLTSKADLFEKATETLGSFIEKTKKNKKLLSPLAALPVGLHLEGPFLSSSMPGAHPKNELRNGDLEAVKKLIKLSKNQIAIMTVAPEIEGGLELIRFLSKSKIRVQIGHTSSSNALVKAACKCGAKGVTHLYNAMKIHHRDPGVLPEILDQKLTAEIITDTLHLDADFVRVLFDNFGSQLYGVSDSCSGKTLGSLDVFVKGIGAYVVGSETLAGGATFLTEHPSLLKKAWSKDAQIPSPASFFKLFYQNQSELFRSTATRLKGRFNFFDQKSWLFLKTR